MAGRPMRTMASRTSPRMRTTCSAISCLEPFKISAFIDSPHAGRSIGDDAAKVGGTAECSKPITPCREAIAARCSPVSRSRSRAPSIENLRGPERHAGTKLRASPMSEITTSPGTWDSRLVVAKGHRRLVGVSGEGRHCPPNSLPQSEIRNLQRQPSAPPPALTLPGRRPTVPSRVPDEARTLCPGASSSSMA